MNPEPLQADAGEALLALISGLLAEMQPGRAARAKIGLDSHLERDLGIDSLARVELGLRIEQVFGVRLPEGLVTEVDTPRALLEAIGRAPGARVGGASRERAVAPQEDVAGEPDGAQTLLDVLEWHVARHPGRLHITFLESEDATEEITYGELAARARHVAAGLQAAGVKPREVVALMLPSGLDFFAAYYGILYAGAVPVPIYPPFRLSQIEDHLRRQAGILSNCEAVMLVTVPEAKLLSRLLRGEVSSLRAVTTVAELERDRGEPAPVAVSPDDIAFIQYTSGSTGSPKGVVLTHAHLLANMRAMGHAAHATSRDVFVSWLPLYHDMGLIGAWLCTLYFAIHLALMSPVAFLSRPARWLQAIHRYRGTISAAPNFAYELCATRLPEGELEGLDLSSLRWLFNGAEPVSADTLARFADRFESHGLDRLALAPVYGLAECALDLAFPQGRRGPLIDHIDREALTHAGRAAPVEEDDPGAMRMVANGTALPGYEIRIADVHGRSLPERTEGRVEFKGPSATSGYYRNPEATAKLFDGEWLDTGDLGYLADGELYLTGRAKDMIIRGGHNIYPYELEEAVGNLEGIRKGCVAVFGVRDRAESTDRVVVVAETRETDEDRRDALREKINHLAVDLIGGPADEIVLAPPQTVRKTSSGKIRRSATREVYARGLVGAGRPAVWRQFVNLALASARARTRQGVRRLGELLYGAWVWLVFLLVALGGVIVSVLPGLALRRAAARVLARTLVGAAGIPLKVEGVEHFPTGRPFVVVANHASYADAVALFAALPCDVAYVAKAEFRQQPLMRHLLESVGTKFVERFDAQQGVADARALAELAVNGESLGFFPEGTFRPRPGLLPFRMGAFLTAAQAGMPVVPIALAGTRKVLPHPSWRPRRALVRVTVGEPIAPAGSDWSAAVALRDASRAAILPHCGEPDALKEIR